MTVQIDALLEDELNVAGAIAQAAYDRPSSYETVLRRYLRLQPDGWYLARLDSEPVGLGGAIDFGPFASLGMMSVLPAQQKRGIGQALMEHLLGWLDARGCPTVLLNARPQAISLYERYGFVTVEQTQQVKLPSHPLAQEIINSVSVASANDLPILASLDAPAFGAARLAVLASYFERDPQRFLIFRDVYGDAQGFLVAGESMLGPWYAATPDVAEALLKSALRLPYMSGPLASFLESNSVAKALLTRYGGEAHATLAHMRRGQALQRDPDYQLYAMASLMLC